MGKELQKNKHHAIEKFCNKNKNHAIEKFCNTNIRNSGDETRHKFLSKQKKF
jgi:hypothetical protein